MTTKTTKNAFTLAEMLVVLLLVSIILAVMAPVMTTKIKSDKNSASSPWKWIGTSNIDAYFGAKDVQRASIGQNSLTNDDKAKLIINNKAGAYSHILFKKDDKSLAKLGVTEDSISLGSGNLKGKNNTLLGIESLSKNESGSGNIAIGYKANSYAVSVNNSIAIGTNVQATKDTNIALGVDAKATGIMSTALGYDARATGDNSTAIGRTAIASGVYSIAISPGGKKGTNISGEEYTSYNAIASGYNSIAIGRDAEATGANSVAIGSFAKADKKNQITLGSGDDSTVYIPGNLVVGKISYLGYKYDSDGNIVPNGSYGTDESALYANLGHRHAYDPAVGPVVNTEKDDAHLKVSDSRLKYVGAEFKSGLDKIRQLKVFNYTFKKDKEKTPHVGVIAQDLEKIFPNAVTKGEDGFLRIRMEDMFYALINAVKELDEKLTVILNEVRELKTKIQNDNNQLRKENAELRARLDKIEAKLK